MFSLFRHTFRAWSRGTSGARPSQPPSGRLQCEALEERVVPSITTSPALVNTTKLGVQNQAATAVASNGTSVVVWTEAKGSRDSDVKAQRYDAAGRKVGGEIAVATGRNPQHRPTVALDGAGSFVVVWVHNYSPTDGDIHAAVFRADGSRVGREFKVVDTPKHEFDPSVGRAANGDFVVSYTVQLTSSDFDVKAVQYRANLSVARRLDVATSVYREEASQVAVAADGRFAIAYQSRNNIFVSRYSSAGGRLGSTVVASSSRLEANASLGMDNRGNVLVAWQEQNGRDWNILARSLNSSGTLGRVFAVAATSAVETSPAVAVEPASGKAVIAYQSQSGSVVRLQATEFTERQAHVRTSTMGTGLTSAAVSAGGSSRRFVLAAQAGRTSDDADGGVFAVFGTL